MVVARDAQRWQTAPLNAEFYGPPQSTSQQLSNALLSIPMNHLALVANGVLGSNLSQGDSRALQKCGKLAGYRFQLNKVAAPLKVVAGSEIGLTSYWQNVGVTPVYEPWSAFYQLREVPSGNVVWQGQSALNLQSLLPTGGSAVTTSDGLPVPSQVRPGKYQLVLVVKDPLNYYQSPLALASYGVQSDESRPVY